MFDETLIDSDSPTLLPYGQVLSTICQDINFYELLVMREVKASWFLHTTVYLSTNGGDLIPSIVCQEKPVVLTPDGYIKPCTIWQSFK